MVLGRTGEESIFGYPTVYQTIGTASLPNTLRLSSIILILNINASKTIQISAE